MQATITKADLQKLLRGFRGTRDGFAKQYGVRHAKLAIQLWDANRPVAENHYWKSRAQLQAAKAA
jgi:hypothetical protein